MGKCMLVTKGVVNQKGKPSIEFYKDGKPQYYCTGYEDKRTDEEYPECRECPRWALGEQCEKDFEEAQKLNNKAKETSVFYALDEFHNIGKIF